MHIIRINEKEAMNLKERKEGNMGGFGGKKGNNNNKKKCNYVIISAKRRKLK